MIEWGVTVDLAKSPLLDNRALSRELGDCLFTIGVSTPVEPSTLKTYKFHHQRMIPFCGVYEKFTGTYPGSTILWEMDMLSAERLSFDIGRLIESASSSLGRFLLKRSLALNERGLSLQSHRKDVISELPTFKWETPQESSIRCIFLSPTFRRQARWSKA